MKKIIAVVLTATGLVFALTGCGPSIENEPTKVGDGASTYGVMVKGPDGSLVPCIIYSGQKQGGISCDWSKR